jgi:hypothetical protein
MEAILAYLADRRDRGAVSIETMGEVAERVAAR